MVLINDTEQDLYQNGSFGKVYKLEDDCVTVMLDTNKNISYFWISWMGYRKLCFV